MYDGFEFQTFPAVTDVRLRISGDAGILSTEKAGGFVGTVSGPYARQD